MTKQCQSCGMPLKTERDKGTEKDGSLSDKYCAMCYKDGEFINPDATVGQMQKIAENALKEKHWPGFLRKIAIKQISKLDRWKAEP